MSTFGDRVYQMGGVPVGGDLLSLIGDGNVFFVDPGKGDDANDGRQPNGRAVATMQRAINLCTDEQGDVIVRLPGTETVTAVTTTSGKGGIVIVAATSASSPPAGRGAGAEFYLMWGSALTDNSVFDIVSSGRASINGLSFANASTGDDENGAAINIEDSGGGSPSFNYIMNCEFPSWGTNNSGVYLHGAAHTYIVRNSFGGASGTLPFGVVLGGSATNNPINNVIEDNYFSNVTIGIRFQDGTPQDTLIKDNTFISLGTANIDFDGGGAAQDGFIVGNNFFGSVSTAVDSITGGTDTVSGVIGDTGFEFAGNNYLET